jgi:hypothetical protein
MDSTSNCCWLLNVKMSDAFVTHAQMLNARKDRAEFVEGGPGLDKVF